MCVRHYFRNTLTIHSMRSTIEEIEAAVSQLSPAQLADFRTWFAEFEAQRWDQQLEADVAAGRLNALADEALLDSREGRTRAR